MTDKSNSSIVVRMAPSPTGNLHIGTARTALFNYLYARKVGGKYVLRLEDTDKERSTKEFEENILHGLKWLGLEHDEFYKQSERTEVYTRYVKMMLENGTAYISKEEVKEPGQRPEVIRFKNPNKKISFSDEVRGEIEFDTTELGDFIVARSETEPLYHLAVVIDDFEMGVTHVIRGEDHISNTPRQILIQEAIGAPRPTYAHLPLIFDAEHKKLSKRKHGATVWVDSYKEEGYMPEALLNFFAFMGWNPGTDKEVFTLKELVGAFDIDRVQKGAAVFNIEKLRWFNKEHLKLHMEETLAQIKDKLRNKFNTEIHPKLAEIAFERIEVLGDVDKLVEAGEFDCFFTVPELDKGKIVWNDSSPEETAEHLRKVIEIIEAGGDLMAYAEEKGKGSVLWPTRYALSGREKSPDPFTIISILGPEESVRRIKNAIDALT